MTIANFGICLLSLEGTIPLAHLHLGRISTATSGAVPGGSRLTYSCLFQVNNEPTPGQRFDAGLTSRS
jgi:hypothetical protein